MGNQWGLGLHLIFLSFFLVATTITCLAAQNLTVGCHERERLALLEFKHSVKDDFKMLSSWVGIDCCSWKGVRCDGATGRVASLLLRGNYWMSSVNNLTEDYYLIRGEYYYLVGDKVNSYLAELRHLKHLDLSGNNFQESRIPKFVGSFKQLSYLNLSNGGFSGIIPHHIGNLSNLKVLDLSSFYIHSRQVKLNDMAWVSGLSSLEYIDLCWVDLSQAKNTDMVFYMIPSLTYLSLSDCGLSNVDLVLHVNSSKILPHIKHLDLGFNSFEGQLPLLFQNMTSLTFLDLSFNELNLAWNSLKLLNMIPSLSELHLSHCGLHTVSFSPSCLNSSAHSNIQYLDVSQNLFQDRFPSELMNMTSLRVLDLSQNSLNSSIPVMPNLLRLDVSDNNFKQIEHVGIWRQCYLKELSISVNYLIRGDQMIGPSTNTSECSQYALEMLDLSGNGLNGSIPESIERLTSLRVLNLESNQLTGSIPKALKRLRSLEVLNLAINNLTGPIPTFQGKLTKLDLSGNQFSGSIPESLGRYTNLTELFLYSNQLTGPIPASLGRLTGLTELFLDSNQLSGPIPASLGRLTSLTELFLYSNQLTGPVPRSLGRLTCLTELLLHSNQLTGPIPASLGRLTSLTELDLSSNKLTGPMPASVGRLASLGRFSISSNLLNGKLPVSIGQLTKLVILDVSNNSLEGELLEAHFANLSMLKRLDTTSNHKLIFNISDEWIPPFQLRNVRLGSCKIAHGFPHWLQTQSTLRELVLSNARLYGLLPTWLQKMPYIYRVDLSHNKLSGSLINLPLSKDTQYLILRDNLFNGSIPRSLCKRTYLGIFDVSMNKLSGNIPDCVGNLKRIQMLILSSNRLSGVLPSSLGNASSLEWLKLNDNKFNGEFPHDLGNLTFLSVLDLGNNDFSGNIPKWIGKNLTYLVVFRLHKNNFTGKIPQSLCKCSYLHILDVAHNNLTGSIPPCFGELSGMIDSRQQGYFGSTLEEERDVPDVNQVIKGFQLEYTKTWHLLFNMDLSSNKLTGEISPGMTALALLMGLNLSHNHLNGSIPDSIGNMKALYSLDFSDNHLTGMIPPSMAALNFLSCLNLSHNNLSGPIPTGNQLQTLTDPSIYAGNKDLCGPPLSNNCSNPGNPPTTIKNKYKDADQPKKIWFYVDIMGGFATGFWGIIGVLLFKKVWREKLFMIAEVTMDKVYVAVAVRVYKIKRGREAN